METDLKLYGNELNYFTTFFNIGYMIMLYPSCIIISHVGPSIWLPACEVYGLRFLIGFFEGATWPGYFTIISQWYLPSEMALRMSIYNIAQPAGAVLSGAMQGGLSTNFDGALGRSGWRWAFIINPDRPNPLSRLYLRPCDIVSDVSWYMAIRTKSDYSVAWALGTGTTPISYFNLWLKSLKNPHGTLRYFVAMLNYLPIAGQAIQLVAEILCSGFSDYFGTRLPFLLLHSIKVINITALSILAARPDNVSFYMAG
ncbi:Major facilitator superfamily domain general substrate transporter [Penicillium sp. IBT 35674x]|nr:Major facilitator superfamily domain general substrate transporter [Penicillium sp. IBT 35674x]